jgi:hypothetical protein
VEAEAAAEDEHALVTQRRQGAADGQVLGRVEPALE